MVLLNDRLLLLNMESIEGYQDIKNFRLEVGKKYYFFIEYKTNISGKEKISMPKIGEYLGRERSCIRFQTEDNIVEIFYENDGYCLYVKEIEDFCRIF